MRVYNFGASGSKPSNVKKLFHATCREAGVFKWAQFLGKARPLKFGSAKFGAISDNFKLRSRISPERDKISKIGKTCDNQRFLPRSTRKVR